MNRQFTCKRCRKELDVIRGPEDWFVVKDELWKEVCKRNAWDPGTTHLCTSCFEALLRRPLKLEDLKLGKHSGGDLPMNLRVITKMWCKNPEEIRTRTPLLEKGRDFLVSLFNDMGETERAKSYESRYNSVLELIKED